jgi:hypothetical protein
MYHQAASSIHLLCSKIYSKDKIEKSAQIIIIDWLMWTMKTYGERN